MPEYLRSLSLSRKQRRLIGACILGLTLFVLFSSLVDRQNDNKPNYTTSRRHLLSSKSNNAPINIPKKRLALLRPFGPDDGSELLKSFALWDTRWPCTSTTDKNDKYEVDLVLSYSRNLDDEDAKPSAQIVEEIQNKFAEENQGGWTECFKVRVNCISETRLEMTWNV